MDSQNPIVESNIKNLALTLMNEQSEIVEKYIDGDMEFSALNDNEFQNNFESIGWKLWYFLYYLYTDEKRGY